MRKSLLSAVGGAVVSLAVIGWGGTATAGPDWNGSYIGLTSAYIFSQATYPTTGQPKGTPAQDLNGAMIGFTAGYDNNFGGLVAGVVGDVVFGNVQSSARDGNYLVETAKINVSGSIRGRVGFDAGKWLPFVTGGVMFTNLQQGETCPADPASVVAGFCKTNAGLDVSQAKTLVGGTIGGGIDVMLSPGWSAQLQYLHSFFPTTDYVLGVDKSNVPLGALPTTLKYDQVNMTVAKHF
jgi:opacity protein-like surface antigen